MKIILIIGTLAAAGAIFIHRQAIMEYCGMTQATGNVQIQSSAPEPKNLPRTKSQRQEHSPMQQGAQHKAQSKQQNSKRYQHENSPSTYNSLIKK